MPATGQQEDPRPFYLNERYDALGHYQSSACYGRPMTMQLNYSSHLDERGSSAQRSSTSATSSNFTSSVPELALSDDMPETPRFELNHSIVDLSPNNDFTGNDYTPQGSRKKPGSGQRIQPRSAQHARELERNRSAAEKYRSRQKRHIGNLVQRARQEEELLAMHRSMVTSLEKELRQIRNELSSRLEAQRLSLNG